MARLVGAATIVVAMLVTTVSVGSIAQAATVHEIEGRWIAPPATIARGEPVVAEWRINVNDDNAAPTNLPVDNVVAEFNADKALFDGIPDMCLTGAEYTPPSSISPEGTTLTCNFGTVVQGTAIVLQTPVIADGITNEEIGLNGSIGGETVELPRIPIRNPFAMDIHYGGTTTFERWNDTYTVVDVDVQWTLRLGSGSDPGPANVQYILNVGATGNPAPNVNVGIHPNTSESDGCTRFDLGNADGHPWSRTDLAASHPRNANHPTGCTLEEISPGVFRLTLTGIDYSLADVPTHDSSNNLLPTNWNAVASGTLWFRVITDAAGSIALDSNEPTYTSVTGQEYTDRPGNNETNKPYTLPGSFSNAWYRWYTRSGGNAWDDTYRVSNGTTLRQGVNTGFGAVDNADPTTTYGNCLAFDWRYLRLDPAPPPTQAGGGATRDVAPVELVGFDPGEFWTNPDVLEDSASADHPDITIEYYTGNHPLLTPGSGQYDPNTFTCNLDPTGWSTTPPDDLSTVKAVRATYPFGLYAETGHDYLQLGAHTQVLPQAETPIGTDVWTFGSALREGYGWSFGVGEPFESRVVTPTDPARYAHTNGRRDIVRIITALPVIRKRAAQATVTPGVAADFTLIYSATGSGLIPATVDDYTIVDTLPVGMSYVDGSASIPPLSVSPDGRVITWEIDGVPTNQQHPLTYQAVADDTVAPGTPLTNTAVSSYNGQDSTPASRTVTTTTNGYTAVLKTPDALYIPNPDASGDGIGTWTVAIQSNDPLPQPFTDTIDILPHTADERETADGLTTSYNGTYALDSVVVPDGATVYYTDASPTDPAVGLSDDPDAPSNGARGTIDGNTVGWTTTRPANVTAIRVIGPELRSGDTFEFQVRIATDGALPGDSWVNRAQSRAGHTELVMRTSAPLVMAHQYAYDLKKYVQDTNGVWHDAQEPGDYPTFDVGDAIPYRIVVTNTGQGDLTDIAVTDDVFDSGSFTIDSLPAGDSFTHEFTEVATEAMLGSVVNTACATVTEPPYDAPAPEDVCDPAGVLVSDTDFDKVLIGKTPNGDGTYTITYDVTVSRVGDGPDYDLTDTLQYGASATILSTSVSNTAPGGISTNATWNGGSVPAVASDVPIGDGDSHTYRMVVVAEVDEPGTTAAMSDCSMGAGETGTGFTNTAQLTTGTRVFDDDACVEYPAPVITKAIAAGPSDLGGGRWEIAYTVTATNQGVDPTVYDLDDTLRYGAGISVQSAAVANTTPGGLATRPTWNGTTDVRVATAVPIDGDTSHAYTVRVVYTVASGTSASALDCTLGSGESGTGLLNTATLSHNGEVLTADACAVTPPPPLPLPPAGELPGTGGNSVPTAKLGGALLVAGVLAVLATLRRRPARALGDTG